MAFDPKLLRESFSFYEDGDRFAAEIARLSNEIVSSRHATGPMAGLPIPYEKELYGGTPWKWLKEGAKLDPYDHKHGIDSNGQIRLIGNSQNDQWQCIVSNEGSYIEIIAEEIMRFVLDRESHLLEHHRLSASRGLSSYYQWDGNNLHTVVTTAWNHRPKKIAGEPWGEVEVYARIRQSYRHDGEGLKQITEEYLNEDGTVNSEIGEEIKYTRLPKGVTSASLGLSIQNMLCEQIPPLVKEAAVAGQRYYCMLLCYCNEDPAAGWPPFLLLGNATMLESNAFPSAERAYYLWAPDELRELPGNVEIAFTDENLLESCRLQLQVINGIDPIKRVLKKVVVALQAISWEDHISITDNFVISAVDNTSEIDQATDIKKYAPLQFRNLRRLNLI
ncbi:MAG: hypothetical protein ABL888_05030 [Pirellulaceae bacterium]